MAWLSAARVKIYILQCKNAKNRILEDPLNDVEIKNPLGYFQTNLNADVWWVPPNLFVKSRISEHPSVGSSKMIRELH